MKWMDDIDERKGWMDGNLCISNSKFYHDLTQQNPLDKLTS